MIRVVRAMRRRLRYAADRRELEAMDDAQLADLGILRDEIGAYLAGRAGPARGWRPRVIEGGAGRCAPGCCRAA